MNLLTQPGRTLYPLTLLLATAGAAAVVYVAALFRTGNWILTAGTLVGALATLGLFTSTLLSYTSNPLAPSTATRSASAMLFVCLLCEIAIVRPWSPLNAFVYKYAATSKPHKLPFSFWVGIPTLLNAAALVLSNRKLQQLRATR